MDSLAQRVDAVVIGASAGGIEALSILLPALPPGLRAAVFVVQHLPRDRASLLVDIFAPRCAVTLQEAQDKLPIEPGNVYFAPPDYHLLLDAGPQLALSVDAPVHYSRPAIDVLFQSAAELYGPRLLGIVLTGGNQDGAEGLAAVRAAGGLTAVQDPADAQMPLMPECALAKGPADFVLPLRALAHLLGTLDAASRQATSARSAA
ncbi:chemotaxis protein CheB [Pseudorhodoferax sp. Leaf274]|uniref:chemotaxis protein CheB n=1 Tax=Pseudorhodoferax sp. Leaf274 TaxID=1736318 RepID=UPI000702EFA6|nr:chemotaxis protein CheB [Pseudorhodoferax sp. Leaf274]KQP44183.1 chemotaxis protein CheB [Pseudorhodoferax sp. Leaf274]